eukprot:TRINITY_DN4444_c0_g1_i1.p1 TRINITY_DN4444_c0_g1~~TRINITY_DN4444_c0_g1_i1.p1  ORF type:complete len:291 (+),score=52.12 TRINITY_DN4444_c0_g1_i1:33-905(+)
MHRVQQVAVLANKQLQREQLLLRQKLGDLHENVLRAFEDLRTFIEKKGKTDHVLEDRLILQLNIVNLMLPSLSKEQTPGLRQLAKSLLQDFQTSISNYKYSPQTSDPKILDLLLEYITYYQVTLLEEGGRQPLDMKKEVRLTQDHAEELNAFAQNILCHKEKIQSLLVADLENLQKYSEENSHDLTKQTLIINTSENHAVYNKAEEAKAEVHHLSSDEEPDSPVEKTIIASITKKISKMSISPQPYRRNNQGKGNAVAKKQSFTKNFSQRKTRKMFRNSKKSKSKAMSKL